MVKIAAYWIAASYVLGIGLAADELRRPREAWVQAGRDRRFWISLTSIMSFHGLGQYAAVAYLAGVVPRFGGARPRLSPERAWQALRHAVTTRWRRGLRDAPLEPYQEAVRELVLVAALLVFVSSLIHSAVTADHFAHYWPEGVFFAVVTCLQAGWSGLVYRAPCKPRLLKAGLVGNAALVVVWLYSRTLGVQVGPDAGRPEAVGEVDVISTLDELAAVALLALALSRLRSRREPATANDRRVSAMLAGPLVLYSVLAALGGNIAHH